MNIAEDHLKQGFEWLARLKHLFSHFFNNAPLRLFVGFFGGLILAYAVFEFLLHSPIAHIIADSFWGRAPLAPLADLTSPFLVDYFRAPLVIQIAAMVIAGVMATIFTDIATAPIRHAEREQKRFVANASHELRTPLSIMKTTAEVIRMRSDKVTKEEMLEFTDETIEEVNRMSAIIEFFLRFATMENKQHFQMSAVSVAQVINKVLSILGRTAEEKNLTVLFTQRPVATVWGNFTALEEMFLNFIKNAVNHTQAGGSITLSVKEEGDHVLAAISDTGNGISHEDLPHIFEPFFKGTNGARRKGGIGLGLTIVREIAKLHEAKITVESEVGKGTTFFVRFPKY